MNFSYNFNNIENITKLFYGQKYTGSIFRVPGQLKFYQWHKTMFHIKYSLAISMLLTCIDPLSMRNFTVEQGRANRILFLDLWYLDKLLVLSVLC